MMQDVGEQVLMRQHDAFSRSRGAGVKQANDAPWSGVCSMAGSLGRRTPGAGNAL
jgi:hypothetical protein